MKHVCMFPVEIVVQPLTAEPVQACGSCFGSSLLVTDSSPVTFGVGANCSLFRNLPSCPNLFDFFFCFLFFFALYSVLVPFS